MDCDLGNCSIINDKTLNLLLCIAGDITKEELEKLLLSLKCLSDTTMVHVRIVVTKRFHSVFKDNSVVLDLIERIYTDENEWSLWKGRGDPVLHIDLTKWADILLLAPLDLDTMSKVAIGICDDLLTCTLRAWNLTKPIIFCPAISSSVRSQNLTKRHLSTLLSWGYQEMSPKPDSQLPDNAHVNQWADIVEISSKIISVIEEKRT